jgi:hypothetical protein
LEVIVVSYSSEDFKFAELPAPRHEHSQYALKINDFFTGQHEKILLKNSNEPKTLSLNGEQHLIKSKNLT